MAHHAHSMSDQPNNGPSSATLRFLRGFLPSLKKGLRDGTLRGKGKPGMVRKPRKMCKVCGLLWDYISMRADAQSKVMGEFCLECDARLKEGMIALTWADKYAFVTSSAALNDYRGSIVHVSDHVWKAIEVNYKEQIKTKGDGGKEPSE